MGKPIGVFLTDDDDNVLTSKQYDSLDEVMDAIAVLNDFGYVNRQRPALVRHNGKYVEMYRSTNSENEMSDSEVAEQLVEDIQEISKT